MHNLQPSDNGETPLQPQFKDTGGRSGAKCQLVGTLHDLISLIQAKDPAASSHERATILYVVKRVQQMSRVQ